MRIRETDFFGDAITYSGTTYCDITTAKHSGSSAYYHLQNMVKRIRSLDILAISFNNDTSKSKPAMIVTIDRSPDENTKYKKKLSNVQLVVSPPST